MNRKDFFTKTLYNVGAIVALPSILSSCQPVNASTSRKGKDCDLSPSETAGPFPTKTPAELVKSNIVVDRVGVALLMTLTVHDKKNNCLPLSGVYIDVWQCDSHGYYSEYGDHRMQRKDLKNEHFLRGRQLTDIHGEVSFISIFPGWYRGRAPHIHVEVLDQNNRSLRTTQIAFPVEAIDHVYATEHYPGAADTTNERDGIFRNSLSDNMADELIGNTTDGYILKKVIVV